MVYLMDALTEYIEKKVMNEKKVPSFGIEIKRHGESLYSGYFGYSDYDGTKALSKDDLFYMYSMTKPITVSAVMRLVEEGRLSLSDRVDEFLPEFKDVFLLKDGKKVFPDRPVTVKHLFTMTAGLTYDLNTDAIRDLKSRTNNTASTREVVKEFVKTPLISQPGKKFNYSLCHDVLAVVAEQVTGIRFSEYLYRTVFEPLGMKNSFLHTDDGIRKRLVAQYICEGDKYKEYRSDNEFYITDNYDSGGAGLVSNASDYSVFADAMANGGTGKNGYRLLKPETVAALHNAEVGRFEVDGGFTFLNDDSYAYGLGVRTRTKPSENVPVGEFGWDGAAGSYVCMDTMTGLSMVFTMHTRQWPDTLKVVHEELRELAYRIYVKQEKSDEQTV